MDVEKGSQAMLVEGELSRKATGETVMAHSVRAFVPGYAPKEPG